MSLDTAGDLLELSDQGIGFLRIDSPGALVLPYLATDLVKEKDTFVRPARIKCFFGALQFADQLAYLRLIDTIFVFVIVALIAVLLKVKFPFIILIRIEPLIALHQLSVPVTFMFLARVVVGR